MEHLCVFQDERTECIYVPEKTGKLAEYRLCKAVNPGKKGPEFIECFKEWVESDLVEECDPVGASWCERCEVRSLLSSI